MAEVSPPNSTTPSGRLAGQVALITGGTSGIGKATALLFSQEGATVVITGRRVELGQEIVAEIEAHSGRAAFLAADHTRAEDCRQIVERVIADFGRLDILFNNAGVVLSGTAESTTEEAWSNTLELNVTAVWRMSKLVLPYMRAQGGGVIINNASDWGLVAGKNAVAYCTSKGAAVQMTRAMALDHARENIRINAVCPGDTFVERWVQKGYFSGSDSRAVETGLQALGEALPMGRVGQADEIARAVLFLASNDSSFMTGATLVVDGGNTAT
ncbi:MAG: glucose 1-dehydrogenase [Anaerolineae bacterium]|nr:glucose 1-dehydrogenase [Anaerolineae bacterium]